MIRPLLSGVAGALVVAPPAHAIPVMPSVTRDATALTSAVGRARQLANTPEALQLVRCVGNPAALVGAGAHETITAAAAYLPDVTADALDVARARVARTRVRTAPGRQMRTFLVGAIALEAQAVRLTIPAPEQACGEWIHTSRGGQPAPWLVALRDLAPALAAAQRRDDTLERALNLWRVPRGVQPRGGLLY